MVDRQSSQVDVATTQPAGPAAWLPIARRCWRKPRANPPAPAARPAISYAVPKDEPIHSYAVVFRFRSEPIKGTVRTSTGIWVAFFKE